MHTKRDSFFDNGKYTKLSLDHVEKALALNMYSFMRRLRTLQERIIAEYHPANEMKCPVHFVIGQEAAPAAVSAVLRKEDHLYGPHRSHGYYFAKGGTMKGLLAEMYGKSTGANGGKAGSQEISCHAVNFHSGAILAGSVGIAVGAALGFKMRGLDTVSVACLGDGAVDEGLFWEAVSYAQLCRLPVVFLCENNGFSTYSPQLKRQPSDNIHERVAAFGLKTEVLFGNDAPLIYKVLKESVEKARAGEGPIFIETFTYRWHGHVGPEDDDYVGYRSMDELSLWKNNCPLTLLGEKLFEKKWLDVQAKAEIERAASAEVDEAFAFAKSSPFPEPSEWYPQNCCTETPMADRLLQDLSDPADFNFEQDQSIPGPY